MSRVAVAGAGGWGTALAVLAARHGHRVGLWARRPEHARALRQDRENRAYLPGVSLPPDIEVSAAPEVLGDAELFLLAVPTAHLGEVAARLGPQVPAAGLVCCAKGLQDGLRPSEVLGAVLPGCLHTVLSGPNHAEEVGRGLPAAAVLAGDDPDRLHWAADLLRGPTLRLYPSGDPRGVELAGALKNVVVLACGLADGLGLGDSARAAVITRGLREITLLGTALGGRSSTFLGLAGLGDLIATASSPHSRNRAAGIRLAAGVPLAQVLAESRKAVEGVATTRSARRLAHEHGLDLPIVAAVHGVLFEGWSAQRTVNDLMARPARAED